MNDPVAQPDIPGALLLAVPARAQATLYGHAGFRGRFFTVTEEVRSPRRQVHRCASVVSDRPAFRDFEYEFDDQEYHAPMAHAPGPTILVNQHGEPRQ